MSPDLWPRVKALYDDARDLALADREAWLETACEGDAALRAEVERLLAVSEEADAFFDTFGRAIHAEGELAMPTPERVGPWHVVREVGRGGMGQVLLAERDDGLFDQRVAVKLVHAGLGASLLSRFRAERRILAGLDHPGIARLIDGGVSEAGRPYLVMEYVEGEPITRYADRRRLSVDDRLGLAVQVCEAVAYAHRHLVVHRDLKPSNVLVADTDDGPRVKLLDFGIAKLLDAEPGLTLTAEDGRVMTPEYAAPEQVRGEAVTTATDVYALGVLLYELLTGTRPYQLESRVRRAVELAILEATPTEPSTAVTGDAAEARATEPARLRRRLRGDLDQILLKALRKAPERRYDGAASLSADLTRHLEGLPVEARPEAMTYRAGRFVRRHRVGVAAAAAVVVFASAFGGYHLTRVAAERDRAQALNDVLVGLFESPDPTVGGDRELTVSEFLRSSASRLRRDLSGRPSLEAEMLAILASSHLGLGDPAMADSVAALAASAAETLSPGHSARTRALGRFAWTRTYHGDYETSERLYRQLLEEATDADRPRVQNSFAIVLDEMGRDAEARQHSEASIRGYRQLGAARRGELAEALQTFAEIQAGRFTDASLDSAQVLFEEAVALKRVHFGDDHPRVGEATSELAGLAAKRGDSALADSLFAQSLEILEPAYGPQHPTVAAILNNWALARAGAGDPEGAEPLYRRALAIQTAIYGDEHQQTASAIQNIASLLATVPGREADALALYDRVEQIYASVVPDGHPLRAFPHAGRVRVLQRLGRLPEAIREGEVALALLAASLGPDHGATLDLRSRLGLALAEAGRHGEAEPHLRAALESDAATLDAADREAIRAALATGS